MAVDAGLGRENEIRAVIREMIRRYAPAAPARVEDDTRLLEDLDYHSLALLELAVELEDELGLPPWQDADWQGAASDVRTVQDMEDYIMGEIRDRHRVR